VSFTSQPLCHRGTNRTVPIEQEARWAVQSVWMLCGRDTSLASAGSPPETSVQNYHSTLRNISEERRSQNQNQFGNSESAGNSIKYLMCKLYLNQCGVRRVCATPNVSFFAATSVRNIFRSDEYLASYAPDACRKKETCFCVSLRVKCPLFWPNESKAVQCFQQI
jgi:hypothetical protein